MRIIIDIPDDKIDGELAFDALVAVKYFVANNYQSDAVILCNGNRFYLRKTKSGVSLRFH